MVIGQHPLSRRCSWTANDRGDVLPGATAPHCQSGDERAGSRRLHTCKPWADLLGSADPHTARLRSSRNCQTEDHCRKPSHALFRGLRGCLRAGRQCAARGPIRRGRKSWPITIPTPAPAASSRDGNPAPGRRADPNVVVSAGLQLVPSTQHDKPVTTSPARAAAANGSASLPELPSRRPPFTPRQRARGRPGTAPGPRVREADSRFESRDVAAPPLGRIRLEAAAVQPRRSRPAERVVRPARIRRQRRRSAGHDCAGRRRGDGAPPDAAPSRTAQPESNRCQHGAAMLRNWGEFSAAA